MIAHQPASTGAERVLAFDAVKGVLVLVMVAYHVLSITSTGSDQAIQYIRFVSGSFIFISGFVISRFMGERFAQDPGATSRRLAGRGLKVLALFTALNLAIAASGVGNVAKQHLGVAGWGNDAARLYLVGDGRVSSFVILLPIAYLLILSPAILVLLRRSGVAAPAALLLLSLLLAAVPGAAERSLVIEFMLLGIAGAALGAPALSDCLVGRGSSSAMAIAIGLALTLWLTGRFGGHGVFYLAGVAVIVKLLHDGVRLLPESGMLLRHAVRLGHYSLFAYIAQIAVIQLLFRASGARRWPLGIEVAVLCLLTAALTLALCAALERLRSSSRIVDKSYRVVFA